MHRVHFEFGLLFYGCLSNSNPWTSPDEIALLECGIRDVFEPGKAHSASASKSSSLHSGIGAQSAKVTVALTVVDAAEGGANSDSHSTRSSSSMTKVG